MILLKYWHSKSLKKSSNTEDKALHSEAPVSIHHLKHLHLPNKPQTTKHTKIFINIPICGIFIKNLKAPHSLFTNSYYSFTLNFINFLPSRVIYTIVVIFSLFTVPTKIHLNDNCFSQPADSQPIFSSCLPFSDCGLKICL